MTSLSSTCDAIANVSSNTSLEKIDHLSTACERHLGNATEIIDAVENSLRTSEGRQRLMLWILIDRLAKQHQLYLDALRHKIMNLAVHHHPERNTSEYQEFLDLLDHSFTILFGSPLVSLITLQLNEKGGASRSDVRSGEKERSQRAVTVHRSALQTISGFVTKNIPIGRQGAHKHSLQVKTIDSQMAMNVASSYAPAQPVEIIVQAAHADPDAPHGYMKSLPSDHNKNYEEARRKRLREIMEKNREEENSRQEQRLLERVRMETQVKNDDGTKGLGCGDVVDDVQMPLEFPRDEFGVKIGNFPLGVRFVRDAIRSCGGAVELEVLLRRIATLASKEVVANFGDFREFLRIHYPTFRVVLEQEKWIVRLTESAAGDQIVPDDGCTWQSMECPRCSKVVKGRNFARHLNCRSCITAQIALGLQGDFVHRGPIADLAHVAKRIISYRDNFDDGDIDMLTDCLCRSAEVRRFRLASTRQFAPVLKAIGIIRDNWLFRKGVKEVDEAVISADDFSVAQLFSTLGRNIHRLPIPWLEMGDVIDMCHRFSKSVLPPFNPPPRPADPRISLHNEYPGFLLCDSEVDDEDDPSADEELFSDDDAPTFTFAPPVDVAESIFTAGFPRDTKRLQHRMRTAPPMVLNRVLRSDGNQTHRELYAESRNALQNSRPVLSSVRRY